MSANELSLLARYGGLSPDEVWTARTPITPEEREHFKNHLQKEREDAQKKLRAERRDTAIDNERKEALAKTERDAVRRTLESSGRCVHDASPKEGSVFRYPKNADF